MDLLLTAGHRIIHVGIAVVVLLAISSLTLNLLDRFARREFFQVPLFFLLGKLLGAAIGAAFLIEQYQRQYFDLGRFFQPDSAWNISIWQFLGERANPFVYAPFASLDAVLSGAIAKALLLLGLAVMIGAIVVAAFRIWSPWDASRSVGLTLVFALWIGYMILFGVSLIFWLLFWLNVWSLLVVAVVLQHFRHRV